MTKPALQVKDSPIHGKGVFVNKHCFFPRHSMLYEYTGKRCTTHEDDPSGHTFLWGLNDGRFIDGDVGGNDSRWINHSCSPNCEALEIGGRVFIRAKKRLEPGVELFLDYNLSTGTKHTKELRNRYRCLCGSKNCRGTMLGSE